MDDWIARADAVALAVDRGLSTGAAEKCVAEAVASKEVRWSRRVSDPAARQLLGPVGHRVIGRALSVAAALWTDDERLEANDLRWWLDRKLGAPRPAAKPAQEELNRALLEYASAQGRRLKQGLEGDALLLGLGATTRQIKEAYRALPPEFRFTRGNPGK